MIYPKTKFLSSSEPVKSDMLYASKIYRWTIFGIVIYIQERRRRKIRRNRKQRMSAKQAYTLARLKNNPFWFYTLSSGPTGVMSLISPLLGGAEPF